MNLLTPEQQIALLTGHCPLCESPLLLPGPRGGDARNVLCGRCRAEFVASPVASYLLASPCDDWRQASIYEIEVAAYPNGTVPLHHKPTFVLNEMWQLRASGVRMAAAAVLGFDLSKNEIAKELGRLADEMEQIGFKAEREK